MLIIHSDLDYRCIVSDGMAAFGVLQALGTPSRFLNFPDEVSYHRKSSSSGLKMRLITMNRDIGY